MLLHVIIIKMDPHILETAERSSNIPVTFIADAERAKSPSKKENTKTIITDDEKSTGRGIYTTASKSSLLKRYVELVKEEIEKRKFSPPDSRHYGLIGNTSVAFTISGNGTFSDIKIMRSSGDNLLDNTAARAVEATSGIVKRPLHTGKNSIRITIILKYQYSL